MAAYDIPILTRHLDRDEMLELLHSHPDLFANVRFRESQPFLGSLDSAVLASLTGAGAAVVVSLINGLFLVWKDRLAQKQAKAPQPQPLQPVLIVRTPRASIHVKSVYDLPNEQQIGEEPILEIRLHIETF